MATPKKKSTGARLSLKVDSKAAQDVRDVLDKIRANAAKAQLPAKRTADLEMLRRLNYVLWRHFPGHDQMVRDSALREILAIFGYEVEA